MKAKRIMGIDPGTNRMGYGVLEVCGNSIKCVVIGDIDLSKLKDPYRKLHHIFERVSGLIEEYRPDEVALESPFFGENVQSMLKLGRAQGVSMAAALHHDLQVFEYAPRRIKQAITGVGSAAKEQVAAMLKGMLGIEYNPKRLDATDGLAVALCHHFIVSSPIPASAVKPRATKKSASWEKFLADNPDREIKNNNSNNNKK
jgi:crossover junction endodeoxyribonuclease RuvC